ncbi:hypothetical protein ACOMHN_027489 [Nucella lapillus]
MFLQDQDINILATSLLQTVPAGPVVPTSGKVDSKEPQLRGGDRGDSSGPPPCPAVGDSPLCPDVANHYDSGNLQNFGCDDGSPLLSKMPNEHYRVLRHTRTLHSQMVATLPTPKRQRSLSSLWSTVTAPSF